MEQTPSSVGQSVVLVVDDDPALRLLLHEALIGHIGGEVLEAEDGQVAIETLQERDVDVVITDLRMPRVNGMELIRWAKEHCPDPVFIVNSGLDTFENAAEAIELGVFAFLPKPRSSFEAVWMTVDRALEHRALRRESERLTRALEERNGQLNEKVEQLETVCGLLQRQTMMLEDDLRRAEEIQKALLPHRVPDLDDLQVVGVYRPSRYVGGDLYDVSPIDDDTVYFYVADSAGHGVSAAMLSVLFKHRLRVREPSGRAAMPGDVLRAVNAAIREQCRKRGLFLTAAYGVIHSTTGVVEIASAGHTPLVLWRASGHLELLRSTGPALGLNDEPHYGEHRVELALGDRLLAVTDGVLGDGEGGLERLLDRVRSSQGADSDGATLALLQEVAQSSDVGNDDVTLLLLHRGAGESVFDNGEATTGWHGPLTDPGDAELLRGERDGVTHLSVRGRGTWALSAGFFDCCCQAIDHGLSVEIDLEHCTWLDSTFLGTIHEAVARADQSEVALALHHVGAPIASLFEELHMEDVVRHFSANGHNAPTMWEPVLASRSEAHARILSAHQALASLDEENEREFHDVIEALSADR